MPFGVSGFVQSILVQETVYIGGGGGDKCNIVLAYNTNTEHWTELPHYKTRGFGMTKIDSQLVLAGGYVNHTVGSKMLGVLIPGTDSWSHPYPDMPTARSFCSAVSHNKWLIIVGGRDSRGHSLSTVEILDAENKQWHTAPSTPVVFSDMKTAIIGNTCYLLGGYAGRGLAESTYSVVLPDLLSRLDSTSGGAEIWKKFARPVLPQSSPLSVHGSLLAVGGSDENEEPVSDIYQYQPSVWVWVKVGDLPAPRCDCTCIAMSDKEILVAGGCCSYVVNFHIKHLDIAMVD